nr:hypothetical protein [Tanacetum cinerariifolium]
MLHIPKVAKLKPKLFKFSNFLVYKEGFCEMVKSGWNLNGNLYDRVDSLCKVLDEAQKAIDKEPTSLGLCEEHAHYLLAFTSATLDEESQKAEFMVWDVMDIEIKEALFSIGDDKASDLNSFTAAFFMKAWDVMGNDVIGVIHDYFANGKLIKEINHTIISLVLKVSTPARINDYRPISCCNVLYKCITKIIANRIKGDLGNLVYINQSAFVLGRRISNNILLTQKLMRNYHSRRGPPRCASKVYIQKAYDIIDWAFLKSILIGFGFHHKMVDWIMVCVSTTSYLVCVNGDLHGWFRGKQGLRQGDPLSPYLFTVVMEVLTLILQQKVYNSEVIQYHHLCEKQRIINLCFADDIFLFAKGRPSSVNVIMQALEEFKNVSRLVLSFGFHHKMVDWIMVCVSTTSYLVCVNGDLHGWFRGKQGLRQGDPLSPYLFTVVMEVLTLILQQKRWPLDWPDRFLDLSSIHVLNLIDDLDDALLWRDTKANHRPFLVACA